MPDVDLKINQSWEVLNQRLGILLVCLLNKMLLPKFDEWFIRLEKLITIRGFSALACAKFVMGIFNF